MQLYVKQFLISLLCIFLAACVTPKSPAPDAQGFEIIESSDPCWVIKSPDKCKAINEKYPNTFLFKGKIVTNQKVDPPSNEQNKQLQYETSHQYVKYFQNKLKDSFIHSEGCKNQNNADLCKNIFFKYTKSNSSELLSKQFKFINFYYKENGKKWDLFALSIIPDHEQMLSQIIEMMYMEYETVKEKEQEKKKSKDDPDIKWFN